LFGNKIKVSYDIQFVYVINGSDPLAEARRVRASDDAPPTDVDDEKRKALVADLLLLHPSLRMEPHYRHGFSYGCWVGSREGDCPYPDIEIGVRQAFVPVSYANDPHLLELVDAICAVFARHGYFAYDPQTDALWSMPDAMRRFECTRDAVVQKIGDLGETVVPRAKPEPRRHWWRFWQVRRSRGST
jgi:hypothetical protein